MDKIIQIVRGMIQKDRLFEKGDLLLAAVSGGCDSVFLLRCLCLLKDELKVELKVAHLNHMLRKEEAERDAEWVKRLSDELSVDCVVESENVRAFAEKNSLSLEEAARVCRYDFLEKVKHKLDADKIVLGHTADDQAETLLLRLLRGSGNTGLASMTPKRGHLVRPLLNLRRHDIRKYLDKNGLSYIDDPSNLDLRFTRNIIRHKVIPLIESSINPAVVSVLARTASILSEEDVLLETNAQKDLSRAGKFEGPYLKLDLKAMQNMGVARRRRLLRAAIGALKGDLRNIGSVHIDKTLELVDSGSAGTKINIHSLEVYRDYDSIILGRSVPMAALQYERQVNVPGITTVEEADLALLSSITNSAHVKIDYSASHRAYFDLDHLLLPLCVRNRRPGDRLVPFARKKPKKLKEIFIDDKLPRRERHSIPIILDRGGILWIPGGRRSDRAPLTSKTERVLCIEARKSSHRD
ncbi:tRNA lysidine(34) synthetase TilS [candidate division TA06 bacterium]|uniref:tRNA(Ile)-lysidine synthase n=1 Tax=candidate division TA06 bacterium TaxID=2250710 RepID=A0A523UWS2_UNCT6|nr:MAG: tRNA lysidine(34) synthetase TilS [candidate division TA06 bacterium]